MDESAYFQLLINKQAVLKNTQLHFDHNMCKYNNINIYKKIYISTMLILQ